MPTPVIGNLACTLARLDRLQAVAVVAAVVLLATIAGFAYILAR
jgi:hypothetical protein